MFTKYICRNLASDILCSHNQTDMKKFFTIILLLSLNSFVYSQQNKYELSYESATVELVVLNAKDYTVTDVKPFGVDASIKYNTFFKSWYVIFKAQDGLFQTELKYVKTDSTGVEIVRWDVNKELYYVVNHESTLYFIPLLVEENNQSVTIRFNGVKLVTKD